MKWSGFKLVGLFLGLLGLLFFSSCRNAEVGNSDSFEILNIILNNKIFFIIPCSQEHNEVLDLDKVLTTRLEPPYYPFDTMPCYPTLTMQDNFFDDFKRKCLVVESGVGLEEIKYLNMIKSTYQKAELYLGTMTETDSTKIDLAKLDITRSGLNVIRSDEECDKRHTKYFTFSPVYFNKARDRAVVFLSSYEERFFSERLAYFLKKRGEVWHMTFSEFMGGDMK